MASTRELLLGQSEDRFGSIISASPKKFREEVYRRAGIKARKGGSFALNNSKKNEVRLGKLREAIAGGLELEDQVFDELVRNYLYTQRSMLAEALDFLEVEHDNGLTDAELDFIEELPEERAVLLRDLLLKNHESDDVDLYMAFMNIGS